MAESLGQATVDLIANTGGFEAGMDRAARKMQSVSKEAAYQGNQLEKLVGAIDPVTGALNRLDKQQQQLDSHFKAGRLPVEDYQKFTTILNAQKTATDATVTGFGKLDRQMASNGQTLKQYQNNLRGVPAQFTDIFTSLQGGQAPLTVLLQQGGQLKDMFGGVGSAAKALGGYVVGLINPVTLAAAAIAAVGVAYYQGSKEATAYNTALINTGNFAGTSADSLAGMASRIAETNGTVGQAAALLAQLAASGKIAVGSFELITSAAIATEKATGQAASEIVANFVKIAEDPLKATLKLNETMNYLTETVYSQIKAFEDSGNVQAAAALAQDEYAKAQQARSEGIIENLGYVESAWNTVAAAAKGAWDAFLSVGRDVPLENQIKKAQELVDTLATAKANALPGTPSNSYREEQAQKDLTDLLVQYDERQKRESSSRVAAQQKKDGVEAAQYLDKIHADVSDKQSQRDKARAAYNLNVEKLRAGVASGTVLATDPRLDAERIAKDLDGIDEKYKEKKAARAKAYVEDAGTKELDQAKQVYAALQAQSLAIGTQEGSTRKIGAAAQELAKWEQQIADIKTKGTLTAAQKSLLADESAITAQKQQNAALEAQNVLREKAAASAQKLLSLEQQLNDELQNVQSGFDQQLAGIGLGDEARKRLQDDLKIRGDYQKKLEQLNRDYRKIQNPTAEDTAAYEAQNAVIKSALERRLDIQKNYYAAEDEAQASWSNGALQALNTYMESANDIAAQSRTLVANSLSQLEDAFVKLATDGKLSFKSLADSIIADLARIAAKTLIVQPLLASLTSGGGGVLSGLTGSSSGGSTGTDQALGVLDAAGKSISLATSGFGQAVAAGYTAGEGLIGGIQGAFSSGAGYISNSITSAFATGSSTAASVIAQSTATNTGYQLGGTLVSGEVGSATYATSAASAGLSATSALTYGIGGAIQGYLKAGVKGAVAGAGGAVAGAYAGAAIGTAVPVIGNVIGAAIGAVLGGMFGSSLFGGDWVTKDQGIQLGVKGGDLESYNFEYQKKKGGLFSSNKKRTRLTALDPELQASLDATYATTLGTVIGLFDTLNVELNDAVLDGLNISAVKISTKGKTAEQIQEELVKFFTSLGDAAIGAVDSALGGLGLAGKTVESLTAFVNGLFSVNNVLANLNVGIFDVSVSGAFAAEQLANMSGGLEKFAEASAAYYDKFFADGEKAEDVLKAVGVQFAAVGVGLPASRQGFRDLVEALDITTEAGRQMYSVLIGLAGNAAAAYDILEAKNATAQNAAYSALQRSITAQQKLVSEAYSTTTETLNAALTTAKENVSGLTTVANALSNALKALRGTSVEAIAMLRSQAQATLQSALATARSGGSLVGFKGLEDALTTVSNVDEAVYTSLSDFQLEQARTANIVEELNKLNGKQLTSAEKQAEAIQGQLDTAKKTYDLQIKQYESQLSYAQKQIDALNGVDNSILSVVDAVKAMSAAIVTSLGFLPSQGAGSGSANTSGNNSLLVDTLYNTVLGRDAEAQGAKYWGDLLQKGAVTYQQAAITIAKEALALDASKYNGPVSQESIAASKAAAQKYLDSLQKHAKGTNSWDGGPALMGEFGPELVLPNGGATVYNAQDTARMLNKSGSSDPQAASDTREQARKNDQRWGQLLRYTQYLEQGYINGFPTVAEGSQ